MMNMTNVLKITSSLFLVVSLSACNVKSVSRTVHEDPKNDPAAVAETYPDASETEFNGFDLQKTYEQLSSKESKGLESVLISLDKFVMNPHYVENPRYSSTPRLSTMLSYFNHALLSLYKIGPVSEDLQKRLTRYMAFVKSGCDKALKGCINIDFFKTDYRTAEIIKIYVKALDKTIDDSKVALPSGAKKCDAACTAAVHEYFQTLGLIFDLKNRVRDNELELLYMNRARDYVSYFDSLQALERDNELLRRHASIFENIIANYPADIKNSKFREFVVNFKPWTYSRLEADPFPFGTKRMFNFAAEHFLYAGGKAKLNPDFLEAIKASQEKDDKFGPSFTSIVQTIRKDNASILKNNQIDDSIMDREGFFDEYFFIVDRLYRGHLTIDEVAQIWLGSNKNESKFLDTVDFYMKIQTVKMIIQTNKYMSEIYGQKDLDSGTLLERTIQRSKDISDQWIDMLERFDRISLFTDQQLQKFGSNQDRLRRTRDMISSVRRNINFISVYPNMMLLIYFMNDRNAKMSIATWWGTTITVEPDRIIKAFFEGMLTPYFFFGNDMAGLQRIELIYAFYFALTTNTFETFSVKKDDEGNAMVNYRKFFDQVFRQYMSDEKLTLETALRSFREGEQGSRGLQRFRDFCWGQKNGFQNFPAIPDIPFNDLTHYTLFGNEGVGPTSFAQKLYTNDSPSSHMRDIRVSLERRLALIRTMTELLALEEKRKGNQGEVDETTKYINGELQKLEDLKKAYYYQAYQFHREFNDCMTGLVDAEFARQNALYKMEHDHLSLIYDKMKDLKKLPEAQAKAEIENLFKDSQLELLQGFDDVTVDGLQYSKFSLMQRMRKRIAGLKPTIMYDMPNKEQMVREPYYTLKEYLPLWKDNVLVSKEEFIQSAMKLFNGRDNNSFLSWFSDTQKLGFQKAKIDYLIELYKLGLTLNIPDADQIKPEDIFKEIFQLAKTVHITPEDRQVLTWLGVNRKYERAELSGIFFKEKLNDEKINLFDSFYASVFDNKDSLEEAKTFYKTFISVGSFLFSPDQQDDTVSKIMRRNYRPFVTNSERIVDVFQKAVDAKEKSGFASLPISEVSFEIDNRGELVTYTVDAKSNREPIYLSPKKKQEYWGNIYRFHQTDTNNYFKVKAGDPECDESSNKVPGCDVKLNVKGEMKSGTK